MSSWKCHHHCCSIMSCIYCSAVLHLHIRSLSRGLVQTSHVISTVLASAGCATHLLIAIMWVPCRAPVDLMGKFTCYDLWRLCYSLALQQQCECLTGQQWTQYRMQSNRKLCLIALSEKLVVTVVANLVSMDFYIFTYNACKLHGVVWL